MKTLVMHRHCEYSEEEVPNILDFTLLRSLIGGWVEVAMKTDSENVGAIIPGTTAKDLDSESGVIVMCDSDGHPKGLSHTWFRPWDSASLVGKLYWLSYVHSWTQDGLDMELHPMPKSLVDAMITILKSIGWSELVYFDNEAAKQYHLPGGKLGRS